MRKLEEVLGEHDAAEALIRTAKADTAERRRARGLRSEDAEALIRTAKAKVAQAQAGSGRKALRAEDGVDYRRRVLARLTGRTVDRAHPANAELWKQANERLDQLGL